MVFIHSVYQYDSISFVKPETHALPVMYQFLHPLTTFLQLKTESESIYFIRCFSKMISTLVTVRVFWPAWVLTGWQLMLSTGP